MSHYIFNNNSVAQSISVKTVHTNRNIGANNRKLSGVWQELGLSVEWSALERFLHEVADASLTKVHFWMLDATNLNLFGIEIGVFKLIQHGSNVCSDTNNTDISDRLHQPL